MIKFVQLKQQFDVKKMQEEVCALESELWKPHYNTRDYEGSWTTLQLRSINGKLENSISIQSSALQKNMAYENTILLEKCIYLQSVINFFECEKMSVRLMNLHAGAVIKEHRDFEMNFEKGEARFHIPIQTNRDVAFFIEHEKIPMNEGECWYLNLSLKHSVNNLGNSNRIHLVIDCKVNDWIKKLLTEEAMLTATIDEEKEEVNYSASDKIKIIQQLRMMGTPVSKELADKLEAENN
ncbi:MAG TPA: aspartyl/asparaginyl beta-hydroxylase domain-containing protein [Ginsengibacter sp.]